MDGFFIFQSDDSGYLKLITRMFKIMSIAQETSENYSSILDTQNAIARLSIRGMAEDQRRQAYRMVMGSIDTLLDSCEVYQLKGVPLPEETVTEVGRYRHLFLEDDDDSVRVIPTPASAISHLLLAQEHWQSMWQKTSETIEEAPKRMTVKSLFEGADIMRIPVTRNDWQETPEHAFDLEMERDQWESEILTQIYGEVTAHQEANEIAINRARMQFNGIVWALVTGATTKTRMPYGYQSFSTCKEKYLDWIDLGNFRVLLQQRVLGILNDPKNDRVYNVLKLGDKELAGLMQSLNPEITESHPPGTIENLLQALVYKLSTDMAWDNLPSFFPPGNYCLNQYLGLRKNQAFYQQLNEIVLQRTPIAIMEVARPAKNKSAKIVSIRSSSCEPQPEVSLNDREITILEMLSNGHNLRDITRRTGTEKHQLAKTIKGIYQKFGVNSMPLIIKQCLENSIISSRPTFSRQLKALSRYEAEVLNLAINGFSSQQIAEITGIKACSVSNGVLGRIFRKIGVRSLSHAARIQHEYGIKVIEHPDAVKTPDPTARELKALDLASRGVPHERIAKQLGVRREYLRSRLLSSVYHKITAHNLANAVYIGFTSGLLKPREKTDKIVNPLTDLETKIFGLACLGLTARQAAACCGIDINKQEHALSSTYRKLGATDIATAIRLRFEKLSIPYLTESERVVLLRAAAGESNYQITYHGQAEKQDRILDRLFDRLGVRNIVQALHLSYSHGLLEHGPLRTESGHPLSAQDIVILRYVSHGHSFAQVAEELKLPDTKTVQDNLLTIQRKLKLNSITEVIRRCFETGITL